jgi:hypothetical protein
MGEWLRDDSTLVYPSLHNLLTCSVLYSAEHTACNDHLRGNCEPHSRKKSSEDYYLGPELKKTGTSMDNSLVVLMFVGKAREILLQRFRDLQQEVMEFLASRDKAWVQRHDHDWLMDSAFLVDIVNQLGFQLQGRRETVAAMFVYVNFFKNKLTLLSFQLNINELRNFENIADKL